MWHRYVRLLLAFLLFVKYIQCKHAFNQILKSTLSGTEIFLKNKENDLRKLALVGRVFFIRFGIANMSCGIHEHSDFCSIMIGQTTATTLAWVDSWELTLFWAYTELPNFISQSALFAGGASSWQFCFTVGGCQIWITLGDWLQLTPLLIELAFCCLSCSWNIGRETNNSAILDQSFGKMWTWEKLAIIFFFFGTQKEEIPHVGGWCVNVQCERIPAWVHSHK